jgi:hypothetical protein
VGQVWLVDEREARIAENQATFRRANEQIEQVAADLDQALTVRLIPFVCECADRRCTQVVRLSLKEYEAVRASPSRFAVAHGHEFAHDDEHIVAQGDRFTTVEKVGKAGRMAAESDPR